MQTLPWHGEGRHLAKPAEVRQSDQRQDQRGEQGDCNTQGSQPWQWKVCQGGLVEVNDRLQKLLGRLIAVYRISGQGAAKNVVPLRR